jgi:hypothetical protein
VSTAYLVGATDYEYHEVLGVFSTAEAAEKYRDELLSEGDLGGVNIYVEASTVDMPRKQLPGAWKVEISPDFGIEDIWSTSHKPGTSEVIRDESGHVIRVVATAIKKTTARRRAMELKRQEGIVIPTQPTTDQ